MLLLIKSIKTRSFRDTCHASIEQRRGGDLVPSHFSRLFLFLSVSILSEGDKAISHRLGGHVSVGDSHGRRKTAGLVPVLSSTKEAGDVSIVVVL